MDTAAVNWPGGEREILEWVDIQWNGALLASPNSLTLRSTIWRTGGVVFITSRVLIVDMLKNRIPMHLVAGFVILDAENGVECNESLIIKTYRKNGGEGFVKCFSFSPTFPASSVLPAFSLVPSELYLWPKYEKMP